MESISYSSKNEPSEKSKRLERIDKSLSRLSILRSMNPFKYDGLSGNFIYELIRIELSNLSAEINPYLDVVEKGKDKKYIEEINKLCKEKPIITYRFDNSLAYGRRRIEVKHFNNWEELNKNMNNFYRDLSSWVSTHFKTVGYTEIGADEDDEEESYPDGKLVE